MILWDFGYLSFFKYLGIYQASSDPSEMAFCARIGNSCRMSVQVQASTVVSFVGVHVVHRCAQAWSASSDFLDIGILPPHACGAKISDGQAIKLNGDSYIMQLYYIYIYYGIIRGYI